MKKLKLTLEKARELAKTEEQKTAIDKIIADIDNADVVEAYNATIPQLVEADDAEELGRRVGTDVDLISSTMKYIMGAAALWRERIGWSQKNKRSYTPSVTYSGDRIITVNSPLPELFGMPTEEIAKAFGEKYKSELLKINNFLTK